MWWFKVNGFVALDSKPCQVWLLPSAHTSPFYMYILISVMGLKLMVHGFVAVDSTCKPHFDMYIQYILLHFIIF